MSPAWDLRDPQYHNLCQRFNQGEDNRVLFWCRTKRSLSGIDFLSRSRTAVAALHCGPCCRQYQKYCLRIQLILKSLTKKFRLRWEVPPYYGPRDLRAHALELTVVSPKFALRDWFCPSSSERITRPSAECTHLSSLSRANCKMVRSDCFQSFSVCVK